MSKKLISICIYVYIFTQTVCGQNMLRIANGKILHGMGSVDLWGVELDPDLELPNDHSFLGKTIQPLVVYGVNSIGFSVQRLDNNGRFFSADGKSVNPKAKEQFLRYVNHAYKYRVGTIVNLFSADRRYWLESEEAYRNAAKTIAEILPDYHSVIFIIGDIFGTTSWANNCPYPMNNPKKILELCKIIDKANSKAKLGIPSGMIHKTKLDKVNEPLFFVANHANALAKIITPNQESKTIKDIAYAGKDRIFRRNHVKGKVKKAQNDFLQRIERERMSVQIPMPPIKGSVPSGILTDLEKAEGFAPLFDGKTFDDWTTLRSTWGGWYIEDGILKCKGGQGPWIRTRKRYQSFILRFDYRIHQGGNSGVFIWAPLDGRASHFGMEMQIRGKKTNKPNAGTTGAIYGILAPREDPSNPAGQWNSVEIACCGSKVTIKINDRLAQEFDADQVPMLKNRLREGVIGFQDHGEPIPVWFRNIRIKELKKN
ncbi:MAG: DUF1080 domain-containing protein [Planctomycetota bacterium]|nr:MAG: DUF1080 domain-containing protein [Planctomycetota bacterium]